MTDVGLIQMIISAVKHKQIYFLSNGGAHKCCGAQETFPLFLLSLGGPGCYDCLLMCAHIQIRFLPW